MKKAVMYARVSSKDQEREGYSIPAQLELLQEFAKKEGYQVVSEFVDVESAKEPGRAQFVEMVKFLKKNLCTILVEKTDRLYRNFRDALTLRDLKVDIRFVKQGLSLGPESKSSDKFTHNIHVAVAELYIDNLSEEVRKGLTQKANQGIYPGGLVPIGYYKENGKIKVNFELAAKIKRIFELYSTGDYSVTAVHCEAKNVGLRYPRSGKFVSRSKIERMLKKPFYCGKFTWQGLVYQGDHPQIVSPELFNKVQEVFKSRNKPAYSSHNFPFIGLMRCGECGHSITAETKKGKYVYYHCTGYGGKCKPVYCNQDTIDRQFAGIIRGITIPSGLHDYLKECLEYTLKTKKIEAARQRDVLESQRAKTETRLKKAYSEKLEGKITEDFWKSIYQDGQTELGEINYSLQQLQSNPDLSYDLAQKAIELSYHAESLYLRAEPEDKRKLLKSVLSNCELKGETLYPTYKKPFDILSKGHEPNQWRRGRDSNPGNGFTRSTA